MPGPKGIVSINTLANSSRENNFNLFTRLGLNSLIVTGRVVSIVLDETHPRFKELGEWNGLGIIEYEDVVNPLPL